MSAPATEYCDCDTSKCGSRGQCPVCTGSTACMMFDTCHVDSGQVDPILVLQHCSLQPHHCSSRRVSPPLITHNYRAVTRRHAPCPGSDLPTNLRHVSGEVRVGGLQNGGSQCWEGGGGAGSQPPPPGPAPAAITDSAPAPAPAQGESQMNKKPTRRPGVKPPPDRAKRSIYLFSLKNPIRQLFIQVCVV